MLKYNQQVAKHIQIAARAEGMQIHCQREMPLPSVGNHGLERCDMLFQDVLISHNNIRIKAINKPYSAISTDGWRFRPIAFASSPRCAYDNKS
jgi:hypothetical protein